MHNKLGYTELENPLSIKYKGKKKGGGWTEYE